MIDRPFIEEDGKYHFRSYQWAKLLTGIAETDLVITLRPFETREDLTRYCDFGTIHQLTFRSGPWWRSPSIYSFHRNSLRKMKEILTEGRYDLIVFRMMSQYNLVRAAVRQTPGTMVIMDIDQLFSRIAAERWSGNPVFSNRFYLWEVIRLGRAERRQFRMPLLFTVSGIQDLHYIQYHYSRSGKKPEVVQVQSEELEFSMGKTEDGTGRRSDTGKCWKKLAGRAAVLDRDRKRSTPDSTDSKGE